MKGAVGLDEYMKFMIGQRGRSSPLVYPCLLSLSHINCQAPAARP